jgi:hypothetical protein
VKIVNGRIQTVEPTIKDMAIQLAGTFYEESASTGQRSAAFRRTFPTVDDYLKGRWHERDGSVKRHMPGWQHHVELARQTLVGMLRQPDSVVNPAMKERISDALIEDAANARKFGKKFAQRKERPGEIEEQRRSRVGAVSTGFTPSKRRG